ncbi:hypothetical protein [Thiomonas sp. X19]|uniref:lipase family protein n=1 Tax=Thiomonas sp. X19 TaxID=1050370 RepID=UPI001E2C7643|nr:hypothetical protein [Thiomonas sp. X19]
METRELADGTRQPIQGMGPFDNAWAAWKSLQDEQLYAVVIRGTVHSASSILDDVLATSIRANSALSVNAPDGTSRCLPLAMVSSGNAADAAVHLGFIWGTAILMFHNDLGILKYLLGLPTGSKILITGHSQGAAIATLLHAMLLHASTDATGPLADAIKPKSFQYKSYVFAQPKPGNWQFGHDYAQIAGNQGLALCLNNNRDWVPQVPLTVDLPDEVTNNPIDPYLAAKHPVLLEMANLLGKAAQAGRIAIGDVAQFAAECATDYLGAHIDGLFLSDGTADDSAAYMNFVQCGRLYSLRGYASPEEETDPLWQHHCGNYAKLLALQDSGFG